MKKLFILTLILSTTLSLSGKQITGVVKDSVNGEVLVGAFVADVTGKYVVATDNSGLFSINVPDTSTLTVSYVGYQRFMFKADSIPAHLTILLVPKNNIDPVVVKAVQQHNIHQAGVSEERIPIAMIQKLPALLGNTDITRSLQLLPGISAGAENTSGYYVRGGSHDQNLILVDNAPVYQIYHMYGLVSALNTNAINAFTLYKGGIPSQYGGRASSVLDITLREGNKSRFACEANLGTFASNAVIEGPFLGKNSSFILSARRSMLDIAPMFIKNYTIYLTGFDKNIENTNVDKYNFYDAYLKLSQQLSPKSKVNLSYFNSHDKKPQKIDYIFNNANTFDISNQILSLRWNYQWNPNLFTNVTAYYSGFKTESKNGFKTTDLYSENFIGDETTVASSVNEIACKADLTYNPGQDKLLAGLELSQYQITPYVSRFYSFRSDNLQVDTTFKQQYRLIMLGLHATYDHKVNDRLAVDIGLRTQLINVRSKQYFNVLPYMGIRYKISENIAAKISASQTIQPIHQLTSHSFQSGSMDIWIPVSPTVKPVKAQDIVLSLQIARNNYLFVIEGYYKSMKNLVMYKSGSSYLFDLTHWESMIEQGSGKSYGIEFSAKKTFGKTTGMLSYTYSRSLRRFSHLNNNVTFPYDYDRPHIFACAMSHTFGKHFDIGINWIYTSGQPVTLLNNRYEILNEVNHRGILIDSYENINQFRYPDYHRMDIDLGYRWGKRVEYQIHLGAYNLYNQNNPYRILQSSEGFMYDQLFRVIPYFRMGIKF